MMREQRDVRQIAGEPRRRWFASDRLELIVWFDNAGGFAGFELCYDLRTDEHAIVWRPAAGFSHMAVDNGERRPGKHKSSPVLRPDGRFDADRVRATFLAESDTLPRDIAEYVLGILERHPGFVHTD